jgi:pimeloyl-ACP methyl ester carboxylesterase
VTDNVLVQQRLLAEVFGIERVKLVYGFSMGGMQALHWGALFPDRVEKIAPICGAPRTGLHHLLGRGRPAHFQCCRRPELRRLCAIAGGDFRW